MFQKIMVPLDGSGFGEYALPVAFSLAEKLGAAVEAVTVVTPLTPAHFAEPGLDVENRWYQEAVEEAEKYLRRVRDRMAARRGSVAFTTTVLPGPVIHSLKSHAEEAKVDLVVMTTHGRGPLQRAWLGSVADGLIRRAESPVLLVRPGEAGQADLAGDFTAPHLLIPLDGSERSASVLDRAIPLARGLGSRITLAQVIPPHLPVGSIYLPHVVMEKQEDEKRIEAARAKLGAKAEALRSEGLEADAVVLTGEGPGTALLEYAEEEGVDMVAMATAGRGGVARLVLGSVADKVARGSDVPVLLVRTDD